MDINSLQSHIDARFDKLEDTIKLYGEQLVSHSTRLDFLQGFARISIAIFLSCAGFFALAYFNK